MIEQIVKTENSKGRIMWLDIVKGICMFLIVMSHSYAPEIYQRIYTPFFLAAFFFCSGYTFNARNSFKSFLLHKVRTILVPYWCFGIINAVLAFIADGDNLIDRLFGLLLSINQKNDDLWFVMCLFTLEMMFYFFWLFVFTSDKENVKDKKRLIISGIISVCLSVCGFLFVKVWGIKLPFQIETALIMFPYMLMGFIWKYNVTVPKKLVGGGTAGLLILYLIAVLSYKNTVNIHGEYYLNCSVFFLSAIIGTAMIVFLSMFIEKTIGTTKFAKWIVFIGQNTFVYYAFQSKVIRLLDLVSARLPFSVTAYVKNPLYAIITCAVLAIPAIIINKWFPFILGRTTKRR